MKSIYPLDPSLCPRPTALLSYSDPEGRLQVLPTSWVGVVCSSPAIISLALKHSPRWKGPLMNGGDFVLNLPSQEQLLSAAFRDLLQLEDFGAVGEMGFNFRPGVRTKTFSIAECPVRIECRKTIFTPNYFQDLVRGEVAAVHIGNCIHGLEGPVDLCRIQPFAGPIAAAIDAAIPINLPHASGDPGRPVERNYH